MIWRINMDYDDLTPKTKKVVNAAIDMRLNGKEATNSWILAKNPDMCTLLMAIIENDEELKGFLNGLNPDFTSKLGEKVDEINQAKKGFLGKKSSIRSSNYERDYHKFLFDEVLDDKLNLFNNAITRYQTKNKNKVLKLNFFSPTVIGWTLMNDDIIIKTFAELEDNPEVNEVVTKDKNSYYSKFKSFLNDKMQEEKSISFIERTATDDFIKIPKPHSTQEITKQDSARRGAFNQSFEEKTATLNSTQTSFNYQTVTAKEMTNSVMNNPENIKKKLASIEQKFIGQENAAKLLFFNIIKNQKLASIPNIPSGTRSIMFIDGPSGTGKTAITKDITDNLGLPFVATSITNYSASGYVGGNITDILKELYVKSGGDLSKAERGIVVLDELDKIVNNSSRDLTMKTAVQHQLLDFLGGGKYTIEVDKGQTVEFDTSKLTFVCLGALTNLRNDKMQMSSSRPIGFNVKYDESTKAKNYSITPEDLIKMGFEKELVGRFNTYVHTKDYSKSDLKKILLESKISPLIGFKTLVSSFGKKLVIDEDAYDLIAEAAYDLNTGARSLQTVVNNLNSRYLEELLVGAEEEIHITFEDVKRINEAAFKEKGRC